MISKQFNYAEMFLTLGCNLGCSYCINDVDGVKRDREELSAKKWAKAINRFDWKIPLTLGGGEPTMHKEFYKLLNLIKPEVNLELLTNLTFDPTEFIMKTKPKRFTKGHGAYKSIRASYHPEKHNPISLVNNAQILQDNGFKVGIFGINHPASMKPNIEMAEWARDKGVYFFIKDFLGEIKGHKFGYLKYPDAVGKKEGENVLCRTKNITVGPDGEVYKCHRDLYHAENSIGNIQDTNFSFKYRFRQCGDYGKCNPCDVKARTNRFLEMGDSNVEITK